MVLNLIFKNEKSAIFYQLKYKNKVKLHLKCESTRGKSVNEDLLVVNAKPVKQFSVLILDIRVYFMWNCQRQSYLALNISFAEKLTVCLAIPWPIYLILLMRLIYLVVRSSNESGEFSLQTSLPKPDAIDPR